jgi:hypothetical protein
MGSNDRSLRPHEPMPRFYGSDQQQPHHRLKQVRVNAIANLKFPVQPSQLSTEIPSPLPQSSDNSGINCE